MASSTHRVVELPTGQGRDPLSARIQLPNARTLSLRDKVARFFQASYKVWLSLPKKETGLLATPAVLEEVIHVATAFHTSAEGNVDVVWVKKDMPREALIYEEVGYWRGEAGPGPRLEQIEMQLVRKIPQQIMDCIKNTNNHDMISQYLYCFVDFWCIILRHYLTWLACIFFYGYLCLLQPLIIVGESSKLLNLVLRLTPRILFRDELRVDDFTRFLDGDFDIDSVKALCASTSITYWEELVMCSPDFIQAVGIPIIIHYGPLAHQCAIYIPKYDPYAPYHVPSLREELIGVDRYVRLVIELAQKILATATPIPSDATREACLIKLRAVIMAEATSCGLLQALIKAKSDLTKAGMGFVGVLSKARASETNAGAGLNPQGRRMHLAIRAEGPIQSPLRKAWVISRLNDLRDKMERGQCIRLLACPRDVRHGSEEHARWLFCTVTEGADVINSACISARNMPKTEIEKAASQKGHDASGEAVAKLNTQSIDSSTALLYLSIPQSLRKRSECVYLCSCPHCDHIWLTSDNTGIGAHTCLTIRTEFGPSLRAHVIDLAQGLKEIQDKVDGNDTDEPSVPGVTRCSGALPLAWSLGSRLSQTDKVFQVASSESTSRDRGRATTSDPVWKRAMDDRGRLNIPSIRRQKLNYPYELLSVKAFKKLLFDTKGQPSLPSGIISKPVAKESDTDRKVSDAATREAKDVDLTSNLWIMTTIADQAWETKQAEALKRGDSTAPVQPLYDLGMIRQVIQERINLEKLRPYSYDYSEQEDLLLKKSTEEEVPIASTSTELQQAD